MEKSSYDLKMTKSTLFVKIDLGSLGSFFKASQNLKMCEMFFFEGLDMERVACVSMD